MLQSGLPRETSSSLTKFPVKLCRKDFHLRDSILVIFSQYLHTPKCSNESPKFYEICQIYLLILLDICIFYFLFFETREYILQPWLFILSNLHIIYSHKSCFKYIIKWFQKKKIHNQVIIGCCKINA